ncbi:cytochrome P450, putative [Ricinus communis]|uniref:Cytochrome P450, putative n=1 Tax=Ricinus communis TaxID=3988 RepID=B9SYM2_RICCO|nr:cytochrome P450, putative [Ricinus communis]
MELDYFMSKWLEEHLQSWKDEQVTEERDFIDALLSSVEDQNSLDEHKKENVVKATALNLIIAGTDTTSLTLTWALSLLLNHPKVLERAQEELDNNVGKERWVEESDFKNLPLLQAIIKETMRLYPAGPLSLPREAMEDCYIGGFHVRKGTILLVNVYKLHHDPRIWPNPCEFQPERFLGSNIELDDRSQQFYIPFSSGRRSCPGISSAMQMNHLMLARVLQGFNLSTPMNAPVDMSEASGISLVKSAPLEAIITPRLQSNLY